MVGTTTIANGEWHHVAATYNGAWNLYLDGALDGSLTVNEPANNANIAPVGVGTAMNSSGLRGSDAAVFTGGDFSGAIDEARIWDSARTQAEIQANKTSRSPVRRDSWPASASTRAPARSPATRAGRPRREYIFNGP